MIAVILLSCFTIITSAAPVQPPALSQATQVQQVQSVEATNQKPGAQTLAPLSPTVVQPQPGVSQQLGPLGAPYFVPSMQQYAWSPLGDRLMIVPMQPGVQPALPQQPLNFPLYGYYPLPTFSSPYRNQMLPPFGFPMILQSPLPQTPANQPQPQPNNQVVVPANTPSVADPSGGAPQEAQQQQQQQQNAQIVYMLQQTMSSPLGALSSEELEMAAKTGQLGVYVPTLLTNLQIGGVQPVSQAVGPANIGQASDKPTVLTTSVGAPQTQELASAVPQSHSNSIPAGLEKAVQNVATSQTPVQTEPQPTQGNNPQQS